MVKSRVSTRGRVTIPKDVRDRLGIRPGQVLDFAIDGDRLVATKATDRDPVGAVYGIIGEPGSTDRFLTEIRGAREVSERR